MKKGAKIAIIIGVIILLVAGFFGFNIIKDLKQEQALRVEVDKISKTINEKNYNTEEVNKMLERRIANGDYAVVEDAVKTYMSDSLKSIAKLEALVGDKELPKVLSAENYKKDGPNFTKTKAYIKKTKEDLQTVNTEILNAMDNEKIKEYIASKDVDEHYKKFFEELAFGKEEIIDETDKKKYTDSIDVFKELLDIQEDIINFLSKNKNKWKVQGNQVMFYNQSELNQYNSYLTKINDLSTKMNNL